VTPPAPTSERLALAGLEPFAFGGRRAIFVHPEDPSTCVKAPRTDEDRYGKKDRRKLLPAVLRREYDNNADEARVLARLQKRLGPDFSAHFPEPRGWADTDMGPALLAELIRDHDGPISTTLREAVVTGADFGRITDAWNDLAAFLTRHKLVTRALLEHNIVAQKLASGAYRLVLVDGLGDRAAIPVAALIPGHARAKIRKRLDYCWGRVVALSNGAGAQRDWDTSRWGQGFLRHRGEPDPAPTAKY